MLGPLSFWSVERLSYLAGQRRGLTHHVKREIKAYMTWIEDAVEKHVDDEWRYDSSLEEDYQEALEGASRRQGVDAVSELGTLILNEINDGELPDPEWVRGRGRGICSRLASQSSDTYLNGKIR